MNRTAKLVLAMLFAGILSGCVVYERDGGWHHHYWDYR
jgi:hypothetical protein